MEVADFVSRALELAARGEGHVRPNPPVGAVVVKDGRIVGEGWHRRAGTDHAETAAIKDALLNLGAEEGALRGCSLFVTLEPCSRPGRVGACTDAIALSGISHVVYGAKDPNPVNRGRAARVLARAGVRCEFLGRRGGKERLLAGECYRLIEPFAKHVLTAMPFVTVKLAMSLDGRISDVFGDARWISSGVSRRHTGRLRERVDAVMVGAETVRRDDPSLLSRGRVNKDLIRVVVSASGRLPEKAKVFTDGKNPTLVFGSPEEALEKLGQMGITHVLCEGGLVLARSLAEKGLVDRWIQIVSPVVIGSKPIGEAVRFKCVRSGFSDPAAGDVEVQYGCSRD